MGTEKKIVKEKEKTILSSRTAAKHLNRVLFTAIVLLFILLFISLLYASKLENQCLETCKEIKPACYENGGDIYENIPEQNKPSYWGTINPVGDLN